MSNFYDLLGVDRSASTDEIRAAWKAAIADLDPTDPVFRAYSGAAEVLLDPERRTSYDAKLAPGDEPAAPAAAVPAAESTESTESTEPAAEPVKLEKATKAEESTKPEESAKPEKSAEPAKVAKSEPAGPAGSGPAGWVLAAVGTAAALALALAIFLLVQPGGQLFGDDAPRKVAERSSELQRATISAEGAAERLVPDILSYDYRTLEEDFERRNAHLTEELRKKTVALWEQLQEDAVTNQLQVVTTSEAAGLTRISDDLRTALVVVFFRQDIASKGKAAQQDSRWATFELVREDADSPEWLVQDVCVDSGCE